MGLNLCLGGIVLASDPGPFRSGALPNELTETSDGGINPIGPGVAEAHTNNIPIASRR